MSLFKDEKCALFFQYFGLIVFGYSVFKTGLKIFNNLYAFMGLGQVNLKKYGNWVVVTGCTDGIGKAYTELFAKRSFNIVLISRTLEKLEEQSEYLKKKYSIQTKVIAADFTESNSIYPKIRSEIKDLDIAVLLNNVGMSYKYPENFHVIGESDEYLDNMINCNITSATKMTAIVLPGMVERKGGVIINNSSSSGRVPTPLLTLYSASKAYMDFFSRALDAEYKTQGIIVQSLCPYFVSTKLSAMRSSFMTPKPDQFVNSAVKTIGSQPVTNGCVPHNLQGWLIETLLPEWLYVQQTLSMMGISRSKAIHKIKKREAEQKKE